MLRSVKERSVDGMTEKQIENQKTEEMIVAKVTELMVTMDEIKKYNEVSKNFKKFSLIIISSILILIIVKTWLPFTNLLQGFDPSQAFLLTFLTILIPMAGIALSALFIKRKINKVKTGEWRKESTAGFPWAPKILSEMNWETSFASISSGGVNYAMYGLIKGAAYWIISYFAVGYAFNLTTYLILHQTAVLGGASLWVSLLIAFAYLKKDLTRRFNEIRAIDELFWELRRFSDEFRNAEF
jgi:hypothetical protein